jgi:leucine dehydrogenase
MEPLIANWSGESVISAFDPHSGSWIFIAIHDTTLGPAVGGCRMREYPKPRDALQDAMRLAEGMTAKWAGIGFALGGGKSVLAIPGALEAGRRGCLLRRLGRIVASLRGLYACGPDLGTTPQDMAVIQGETEYVHGWDRERGEPLDPGPFTALGVFVGIRAAIRRVFGTSELTGRSVLVQGVGDVGVPLARMLADAGATVLLSDLVDDRARALGHELGTSTVPAGAVYGTPCDVYAPCAVGATVNAEVVPSLQCRIVAGSANNQLDHPGDAERLHARGILYAPDYIINAGGAISLPMLREGQTIEAVRDRVARIEQTLGEIIDEAAAAGESPFRTADRRVQSVLQEARRSRQSP